MFPPSTHTYTCTVPVHTPDVPTHVPRRMDDRQMPLGAALHAATAIRFLQRAGERRGEEGAHDEL